MGQSAGYKSPMAVQVSYQGMLSCAKKFLECFGCWQNTCFLHMSPVKLSNFLTQGMTILLKQEASVHTSTANKHGKGAFDKSELISALF